MPTNSRGDGAASGAAQEVAGGQWQASLAALRATPRPDQLQIAQLNVDKSQAALAFAQKTYDRQRQLTEQQVTSGKLEPRSYVAIVDRSPETELGIPAAREEAGGL